MRAWLIGVLFPLMAVAQAPIHTEFPAGAVPLDPAALKQRVMGKSLGAKGSDGIEFVVQYGETHAVLNAHTPRGVIQDSAPWRVEGSAICIDFLKVRGGCSEFRLVGDVLYTKRASNGEVVAMQPR